MNKAICKRIYILAEAETITPICISSGIGEHTDSDILMDGNGAPLLPGSSIAGAFRNYLVINRGEEALKPLMGYSKGEEGNMSTLFISDATFEGARVVIRDGVKLENKIVDNKYDYEVIEPGAKVVFRMERIVREGADEELDTLQLLLSAIDEGEIRFGAKKNRGLGWLKIKHVEKAIFAKEDLERWMTFCEHPEKEYQAWEDWKVSLEKKQFLSVVIPLKLTGGISIRKYSAKPDKADFQHITIGKDGEEIPVIPGTSWNGAIRSCANDILTQLGVSVENRRNLIQEWFGYVEHELTAKEKAKKKNGKQSLFAIKESQLTGSTALASTRNKVNRFDASTVDGALYSELAYFGGTTELEIKIRKDQDLSYQPFVGLLLCMAKEIQEGYLAIGGQTAVGRGIFEGNGEIRFSEDIAEEEYLTYLAQAVAGGESKC